MSYKWQAVIVTTLGLFMAVLDTTIVSVALPQIQHAFHTDFSTISWTATGYFLSQAAVIPIIGYLSDRIGTKPVFVTSLLIFTLGSALCAIAPTYQALIAFRVFQGIGGGALLPLAFAIVYRVFAPAERGTATAFIGVPVLLAPALGPTVGGWLTTTYDWRAIFIINVPVGLVTLLLAIWLLQGYAAERATLGVDAPQPSGRFDWVGLVCAMLGFISVAYGASLASTKGWDDGMVRAALIAGGGILLLFVLIELRAADPVLDVRLFRQYTFAVANLLMWALVGFLFGNFFLLPVFFENVQGKTPLNTGILLIGLGLASGVGTAIAGGLYTRLGPRLLTVVGCLCVAVGTYGLTQLHVTTAGGALQGWLIVLGIGMGLSTVALQTLSLAVITNRAMARASSLVNVTRQIASALGISVLTAYLAQQTTAHATAVTQTFTTQQLPSVQAACLQHHTTPDAIHACVTQGAQGYIGTHAATLGLNDTFWLVLVGALVCAGVALFVGRDPSLRAGSAEHPDHPAAATAVMGG